MRRHVQGIALVTALAILAIVTLLVVGTVFTTQIESWTTRNDATSTQAYYIAHAGLEKYKTIAFQTYNFYLNHLQDYGDTLGTTAICGNLLASGLDLNRDFQFTSGDLLPGGSVTKDYEGGQYKVTYAVSGPDIVLTSVGVIHGARATVQVIFRPKNAGLFSNALFAGGGISSQYINGDASVYGSVYVEGDSTNPTTVINSNGNFAMHNYYDSNQIANLFGNTFTTTQLQTMLGSTATNQTDLCARLRVAYGSVATSGSVTLGQDPTSTTVPSGYKSTLAGLNVYNGSSDISQGGNSVIYADNYPNGDVSYDLSQNMQLPNLNTTPCKSDPLHSWRYCLDNGPQASSFPTDASKTTSGTCNLPSQGSTIAFDATSMDCTYDVTTASGTVKHGFTYTYDSSSGTGTLQVYGVVDFQGYDLHFARNVQTRYAGKATIMATTVNGDGGNITVDGDVLPNTTQCVLVGGNCKTPSFPTDEVLGMIAENNLTFSGLTQSSSTTGTKTQTTVGLYYAGNTASIEKSGVVMGSVLAKEISTSSSGNAGQTPTIVQVPGLEYNLAPGFDEIKGDVLATFHILSYERR